MTPDLLYVVACELLGLATVLVQHLSSTAAPTVLAPRACPHPPAAREPRGSLASPWKRFFCRDCSTLISSPKEA
jgi:hypothetical protein